MSDKRLFGTDPLSGAVETFEYDEDTDTTIIHRREDITASLEANKRMQNSGSDGYTPSRDMVLQASIPVGIIFEWLTKYGVNFWDKNDMPAVKRLLNSNEYRYLRVNKLII